MTRTVMTLAHPMIGELARTLLMTFLICLLLPSAVSLAQGNPPTAASTPQNNPLTAHNKMIFGGIKEILRRSAEKMPEEHYSFKPTEVVRSYGQIIGHVADAQYLFCSTVLGEKNPALKIEQTKTSKVELIAALKGAFDYCDKAYDSLTDASAIQVVKMMGGDTPKLGALATNNLHTIEHYGNLVTYMRMKNIVPPTSDPEFMPQPKK